MFHGNDTFGQQKKAPANKFPKRLSNFPTVHHFAIRFVTTAQNVAVRRDNKRPKRIDAAAAAAAARGECTKKMKRNECSNIGERSNIYSIFISDGFLFLHFICTSTIQMRLCLCYEQMMFAW